jgi:signal transduction histidine kinase
MRDPMGTQEAVAWRDSVARSALTVLAALALPVVLIAVLGQSPRSRLDAAVLLAVGIVLPALRLSPGLSVRFRVAAAGALLFAASLFVIARNSFAPGAFLALTAASILVVIYFGRRAAVVLIATACVGFLLIGVLVTSGVLTPTTSSLDPVAMRNWLRIGFVSMLMSALLTLTVDVVIHVESGARATREALHQLAALHDRLEAAKENERRFLAHELHDEFGQILTALKLRIRVVGSAEPEEALALVDDLIARVRKISVGLRPPLLDDVGLVPALRAYLHGQAAASGVSIDLTADPASDDAGGDGRLSPDLEIVCFRVVQESITNVLRHASAHRIDVRVVRRPQTISISILDDGRGFDAAGALGRAAADGHLGVVGMRERVRGRGGTFTLDSRPGAGTRVTAELPVGGNN